MPAFGDAAAFTDRLSDQEIAELSNYVLAQYGGSALRVDAEQVRVARAGGEKPLLAKAQPFMLPALMVLALLVLVGLVALVLRRRAR